MSARETVISQDVNGKLRERAGKEGEEGSRRGLATGLIEIDAVEIFGFLSGSRPGLRGGGRGGSEQA